jgi:hypothetical protein
MTSPAKSAHSAETQRLDAVVPIRPLCSAFRNSQRQMDQYQPPKKGFFAFSFVAFFRSLCSVVP